MLAKANGQQQTEQQAPQGEALSADEEADIDIAASFLTQAILSPESSSSVTAALQTPEPAKTVAILFAQVMEMAQRKSAETDIPMSPRVWLAAGGAVDEVSDDLQMVMDDLGMQEDAYGFLQQVKQEIVPILEKRAPELQAEEAAAMGGGAPQGQASMGPPPGGRGLAQPGLAQGGM